MMECNRKRPDPFFAVKNKNIWIPLSGNVVTHGAGQNVVLPGIDSAHFTIEPPLRDKMGRKWEEGSCT